MAADKADLNGAHPPRAVLTVKSQYLRDFSFENPGAPAALVAGQKSPEITINMDIEVRPQSEAATYEVVLKIKAHAQKSEKTIFLAELAYAGLFSLQDIPENQHRSLLVVEGARLLFPFARAILADATRDGGFPPLMLGPIDFADMFRRSKDAMSDEKKVAKTTANA